MNLPVKRKNPAPGTVPRWFVYNHQGELHDGPFKTRELAEKCAEKYRDFYGEEPTLKQETTRPDSTNVSDPKMNDLSYW
jgi:hypothetical protein